MDSVRVFVSIVPQKYFVKQIGKNMVDVQVMVQPGASPVTYEPKPRQMAELSRTKIYFAIGVPFENIWLKKIVASNAKMKVIHTDYGIKKIPMTVLHHHREEKGHLSGEHRENHQTEHSGLDPHIWLSPPMVKIQAHTMMTALQEIDPSHRSAYEANYRQFVSRIDELNARLKTMFADKQGLRFMVFHPAWGYFARTYGLEQIPIEMEGKDPKPARLQELIEYARKKGIKVIFAQPQFSSKSAELVAKEIGGRVIFADPLAEDWMANMREVAAAFEAALK
jgi:zinc transport system substrate-binding protein